MDRVGARRPAARPLDAYGAERVFEEKTVKMMGEGRGGSPQGSPRHRRGRKHRGDRETARDTVRSTQVEIEKLGMKANASEASALLTYNINNKLKSDAKELEIKLMNKY